MDDKVIESGEEITKDLSDGESIFGLILSSDGSTYEVDLNKEEISFERE